MITHNTKDFRLPEIFTESKLFNFNTAFNYHVFGLKQSSPSLLTIECNTNSTDTSFKKNLEDLKTFLSLNGISYNILNDDYNEIINIGMRKDLRSHNTGSRKPLFASALLSTIIYTLEGRLNNDKLKSYRPNFIPSFSSNTEVCVAA